MYYEDWHFPPYCEHLNKRPDCTICRHARGMRSQDGSEAYDPWSTKGILPGTRVEVYDYRVKEYKAGTVVRHYGSVEEYYPISDSFLGPYPSLIDIQFDHREDISKGYFTWGIKLEDPCCHVKM